MPKRALYMDCSSDMADILAAFDAALVNELEFHHGDPAQAELGELLRGYPLLLNGHTRMPANLLRALRPELERVVYLGTGAANYIDLEVAGELEIEVVTIANYGDRSVAEHTFALVLAAARDVALMDRRLRDGHWEPRSGSELKDKTIGVVGFGGIGREFAGIAHAFGMNVLIWNRSAIDLPDEFARAADLQTLFKSCDVVSLHLAYTSETRHIIDRDLLGSMRPGSLLVNSARAELINQSALHDALTNGPIAHAAIDVFEPEPPSSDDPLLKLPNVTLTAHAAWKTPEASRRLLERGLKELWRED